MSGVNHEEVNRPNSDPSSNVNTHERLCWVCFATEEDDLEAEWVHPCRCKGSSRWLHKTCLQRWIDEKQQGSSSKQVWCPQCNHEYSIVLPDLNFVVYIMDYVNKAVYKICFFMAGGMLVGSIYWTAVTYGAVTVMQLLGHKEGLNVMEKADPLFLLIGLPMVPLSLIFLKMVRWEDFVLKLWRKYSSKLPLISYFFPSSTSSLEYRVPADTTSMNDSLSVTRIICGALVFPTIATLAGKILFSHVVPNFQRTIMGGIVFLAVKSVAKIYYKQQQYLRQAQRTIMNYDDSLEETTTTNNNSNDQ